MKKRIKIPLVILTVLVVLGAVGGLLFSRVVKKFETYLATVKINPVDLNTVSDGTYSARVNTGVIIVELEADVRDHTLRDIRLIEHRHGQGADAEKIIPRILEEQRIDVDTVSGATYSSLVIQDTLFRALTRR